MQKLQKRWNSYETRRFTKLIDSYRDSLSATRVFELEERCMSHTGILAHKFWIYKDRWKISVEKHVAKCIFPSVSIFSQVNRLSKIFTKIDKRTWEVGETIHQTFISLWFLNNRLSSLVDLNSPNDFFFFSCAFTLNFDEGFFFRLAV